MQQLTKQEMQTAMQQLANNITSQVATKQDITRAINTINQQASAQLQVDMQRIFSQYCDRILDRAYQEFKQQNIAMQQINSKIDVLVKRSGESEQRMARLDSAVYSINEQLNEHVAAQDSLVTDTKVVDDERFARRTAFSGLYS